MSLSSAPDQLRYGANSSTPSSISGIDQLLEASTMSASFGQISSRDETWNPVPCNQFSSPEPMGSYPAEFVGSPVSSALDNGWNLQPCSVLSSPNVPLGKCSEAEWPQFQQPPPPLDEHYQAMGYDFPNFDHFCEFRNPAEGRNCTKQGVIVIGHADNMSDVVRLFLIRREISGNGQHDFIFRLLDIHEECLKSDNNHEIAHDIHAVPLDTHLRFAKGMVRSGLRIYDTK